MNCLHGVLMHNDETEGNEHKTEDQYLRFKEALETGEQPVIGTQVTEDELHKMLMHDGKDGHHEENAGILPDVNAEKGPKDPNEFLHEAMHGEEGTMKHDWDGVKEEVPVLHEPLNGEKFMHDILMHGGSEHVENPAGDVEDITVGVAGPDSGEELMHGLLMHGDKDHKHESEPDNEVQNPEKVEIGPKDAENYLHGVLMHNDAEAGMVHEHHEELPKEADGGKRPGPHSDDLHGLLMHGDSEYGQDHSHEDSEIGQSEPFSDILEILNMELDEDLLRVIDIEKLLKKDMEEYKEWIKNNPSFQDETLQGSTDISITDSLLNDIELMKNRYLKSSNDDSQSSSDSDEFPFTAEDAASVLDLEGAEQGKEEDMRHYLELLGTTDPINARHKAKLDLARARLKDDNKDL